MRFVTVNSAGQQARLVGRRRRQGWQEERTAGINRLCGLLAEFGCVYPNSAVAAFAGAKAGLADETPPAALRRGVTRELEHLREPERLIDECDRDIQQDVRDDVRAQRLLRLSGVGMRTTSAAHHGRIQSCSLILRPPLPLALPVESMKPG